MDSFSNHIFFIYVSEKKKNRLFLFATDEDEDDDVVLLGTEKTTDDAEKRDEDDVIFVSEEPSSSINIKSTPRNIKVCEIMVYLVSLVQKFLPSLILMDLVLSFVIITSLL